MDEYIESIFDIIQHRSPDDTIVVITADHGDQHGEHGLLGYILYPDDHLTNVPTIVTGLDNVAFQREHLIQHSDIIKTVLEEAIDNSNNEVHGNNLRTDTRDLAMTQGAATVMKNHSDG